MGKRSYQQQIGDREERALVMLKATQSIKLLRDILLPEQPSTQVVFISLDFEFHTSDAKRIQEIGIATLDTRDLFAPQSSLHVIFPTQDLRWGKGSKKHCFLFGETKRIFPFEMKECLERNI